MRNRQKLVRAIVGVTPVIAVAGMCRTLSAASPVFPFEPFPSSYTDTVLTGQGSWTRASMPATTTAINVSSSANLTNPFSQMPTSTGKGVTINGIGTGTGSNTGADRNAFITGQTTGTVYYSFLLDVNASTGSNTTGGVFISLNNTASNAAQNSDPSVIPAGIAGRIDPTDSTKYDLGIFGSTEALTNANWSTPLPFSAVNDVAHTHLIVASYQINGTGANTSSLWIDPSTSTFGLSAPTATITTTGGNAQTTIGSILLRQSIAPFLTLDELRVGTSWAAVTPTLTQYFDVNGATAGSGIAASITYNWEDPSGFWNGVSDGTGTNAAWGGSAYTAVFSAGSDGTSAYTVNISAASESCSAVSVTAGSPTITGNGLSVATGTVGVATGASIQFNNSLNAGTNFSVIGGTSATFGGSVVLNAAASYSGTTTINFATLQIGAGGPTGSIPASSVITDNGTLAFNRSGTLTQGTDFDSNSAGISGTGNIVQLSSGTVVLNGTNTYTGLTTASAGTVQIGTSLAAQNSTIDTTGAGSINFGSLSAVTVGGLSGATNYASSASSVAITLDGTVRSSSFGGAISGTGTSLTVKLPNTNGVPPIYQSLYGVNTYTGGTTISSGMLQFNTLTSMPATGTVSALKGGILSVRAGGAGEWTNDTTTSTNGALGALIAGVGGQGAPVAWTAGSTLGISTLNSGGSLTYAGNIAGFNTGAGTTDEVGLRKTGSNTTLTLTGTSNTFSGPVSIDNDGGVLALKTAAPNAGSAFADYGQAVPTTTIGSANTSGTVTDGSQDTGIKILTNNALPGNTLINFGSSATGTDKPSALIQLYDTFVANAGFPDPTTNPSFNQTVRGLSIGGGRVKAGLGTFTVFVPASESYSFTGTIRTDNDGALFGQFVKDGPGEQDFSSPSSKFTGNLVLNAGTLGISDGATFGNASSNAFIINGGTLKNLGNAGLTLALPNMQLGGNFTFNLNGSNNTVTSSSTTVTLTSNSTINVTGGTGSAVAGLNANIIDNGNNYSLTKGGTGTLNLGLRADGQQNNYSGDTNVQQGELRITADQVFGNGTSNVNLQGGNLATQGAPDVNNGHRFVTAANAVNVSADASIVFDSTAANITDVTDPTGVQFIFSGTPSWTAGKITFGYQDTVATTTATYRPQFSGSGFTYGGPIEVDNGATGTHPTVLEFGNASGTQTFNGNFTGTGSISRLTGGTTALGGSSVVVGGVAVANSSVLRMARSASHDHVMKTAALSIGTSGSQLDLMNNSLIVTGTVAGSWNGSAYSGIAGSVVSGRGAITGGQPAWNGSGIVTSMTQATTTTLTTLAVASAQDLYGITGTGTASFAGQTVHATDALVKYTYAGDANLDGKVNADDYFQIDSNYNKNGNNAFISFHNGDFNYDGVINGDDYALIDTAFASQGSISLSAPGIGGGLAGVSAVPEPASIMGLIVMGAAAGMRRRRRAR